jgi:hypothetical protein
VCYEEEGDTFENGVAVSGSWNKNYFLNSYAKCFSRPESATRFEGYSANVSPGETGFEFHYPVDDYVINAQCGGTAQGTYSSKYTHCYESGSDQSSGSCSSGYGISAEFNEDQCSITKTDVSYKVQGSKTTVVYHSGGERITRTRSLNATIDMIDAITGVEPVQSNIPASYCLQQNYPNPCNPSTMIGYQIPVASHVSLKIYDILGREVATLVDAGKEAGSYNVTFNAGEKLTSGVYIARLVAQSYGKYQENKTFVQAKKILLVK